VSTCVLKDVGFSPVPSLLSPPFFLLFPIWVFFCILLAPPPCLFVFMKARFYGSRGLGVRYRLTASDAILQGRSPPHFSLRHEGRGFSAVTSSKPLLLLAVNCLSGKHDRRIFTTPRPVKCVHPFPKCGWPWPFFQSSVLPVFSSELTLFCLHWF